MTIEELISRVFADRNASHLAHWAATGPGSYAKHMALGDFYDALPGSIDSIVECYQGAFNLVGPVAPAAEGPEDILDRLEESAAWIETNRDRICRRNSALGNLVDTLLESYFSAIYKLRNLH